MNDSRPVCLCCGGGGIVHSRLIRAYINPQYQDWDPAIRCGFPGCTGHMTFLEGGAAMPRFGSNVDIAFSPPGFVGDWGVCCQRIAAAEYQRGQAERESIPVFKEYLKEKLQEMKARKFKVGLPLTQEEIANGF